MPDQGEYIENEENERGNEPFDYTFVHTVARVAVYDDLKMAPHVIEIEPAPTAEYIEKLADVITEQSTRRGGKIPYSAIREVSENFIHARFTEVVVSILDGGNTIRFCDQGPGIKDKTNATRPGFTSAIEPMKHYIRGVGSGLPLVKEYLTFSNGEMTIEDNMNNGSVVTLSLKQEPSIPPQPVAQPAAPTIPQPVSVPMIPLSDREKMALELFASEGALSVTEFVNLTGLGNSSVFNLMKKMEEYNLIEKTPNKKRMLTDYGDAVWQQMQNQ